MLGLQFYWCLQQLCKLSEVIPDRNSLAEFVFAGIWGVIDVEMVLLI